MKCSNCDTDMQKSESGYVCPKCGASIKGVEQSPANRTTGWVLLLIGLGGAALMFYQAATGHAITIAHIPIPFGLECVGIVFLLIAVAGLSGALGKIDLSKK